MKKYKDFYNNSLNEKEYYEVFDVNVEDLENNLIPFKYKNSDCKGKFVCKNLNLTSLENCPDKVHFDFSAKENNLTNLEHCPSYIGGAFNVSLNNLTSLKYFPKEIHGIIVLKDNNLTKLENIPTKVESLYLNYNRLTDLKGSPKIINDGYFLIGNPLTSLEGCPEHIEHSINLISCSDLKSLEYICANTNNVYVDKRLRIEKEFVTSKYYDKPLHGKEYFKNLLNFCLKYNHSIENINWPDDFLSDELKNTIKKSNKFNL